MDREIIEIERKRIPKHSPLKTDGIYVAIKQK